MIGRLRRSLYVGRMTEYLSLVTAFVGAMASVGVERRAGVGNREIEAVVVKCPCLLIKRVETSIKKSRQVNE